MSESEPNLSRQFLQACQAGDLAKVKNLTKKYDIKNWTIYRHDVSGDTSLHLAAREGHLEVVRYLCEGWDQPECKVDVANKDAKRPLHEAAQFARADTLEYLIRQGASIDALKRADWTPLMLACTKKGDDACRCIRALLKANANSSLRNKDGWTSLHVACRTGDVNAVNLLLKHSSKCIDARSNNGRSTLHVAAFHGCRDIVDVLVSVSPDLLNVRDSSGSIPLLESVKSGNLSVSKRLVTLGADIKAVDNVGQNALHVAAQIGNVEMLEYILRNDLIDVHSETSFFMTPFAVACRSKQNEAIEVLLRYGANDR